MARKKGRGNGTGTVYPRRDKQGKIIGYRGSYRVQSAEVPKRRYVSGKTKAKTRVALNKARADLDGGFVYDAGTLTLGEYLSR
jgi:integrase